MLWGELVFLLRQNSHARPPRSYFTASPGSPAPGGATRFSRLGSATGHGPAYFWGGLWLPAAPLKGERQHGEALISNAAACPAAPVTVIATCATSLRNLRNLVLGVVSACLFFASSFGTLDPFELLHPRRRWGLHSDSPKHGRFPPGQSLQMQHQPVLFRTSSLAVGECSVILMTPPCVSLLKHLLKVQWGCHPNGRTRAGGYRSHSDRAARDGGGGIDVAWLDHNRG